MKAKRQGNPCIAIWPPRDCSLLSQYLQCNRHVSLHDDNKKARWFCFFCFPPARLPLTCRELGWKGPKRQRVQLTGAPWWPKARALTVRGWDLFIRYASVISYSVLRNWTRFSQSRLYNEQVEKWFSSKQKQRRGRKDAFFFFLILQVCKFNLL